MSHWAVLHDSSFHSHTVLLFDKTNAAQSTGGLHVFSFNFNLKFPRGVEM